jgi:hypothetical protein
MVAAAVALRLLAGAAAGVGLTSGFYVPMLAPRNYEAEEEVSICISNDPQVCPFVGGHGTPPGYSHVCLRFA